MVENIYSVEKATEICQASTANKNLVKHMIATGSAMRALAQYFGENEEDTILWEIAGILHDIDYDETAEDFPNHGKISKRKLDELGYPEALTLAVSRHPAHSDNMPVTKMDWALHITDPLTGLIVACALMHPAKKISALDNSFVLSRFKEKRFAAGANREQIALCEEKLSIPLPGFIDIVTSGMVSCSGFLGL